MFEFCGLFQDTKPHREFSFSQILDALEYELPHKGPSSTHPMYPHHQQSSASTDDGDDGHSPHTFKIVTTKRTLLLCSPSEEEEIKWLGAVRALIARRSGTGAPSNIAAAKAADPEALPPSTATVGSIDTIKGKAARPSAVGAGPILEVVDKQP
jgi:pleckstrin homology domain-containing family A member 1/2